ncbi:hypothetical protein D3C72_1944760 [compost metagenome]
MPTRRITADAEAYGSSAGISTSPYSIHSRPWVSSTSVAARRTRSHTASVATAMAKVSRPSPNTGSNVSGIARRASCACAQGLSVSIITPSAPEAIICNWL